MDHDDVVPSAPAHQRDDDDHAVSLTSDISASHISNVLVHLHQRYDGHGREIRVTCAPESPNISRSGVMD